MSSGFITESEILEARRQRQEEWEKVRTEDQPKEAPEEAYDNRPLYQRLEEQRMKKEAEYEEAHKLKNMIRGLDDDEVGFLDLVERTKAEVAQQISIEEKKEMQEFRERVSSLAESEELTRLRAQLAPTRAPAVPTQNRHKLEGVIVRKRKASEIEDSAPPTKNGVINHNDSNQTEKNGLTDVPSTPSTPSTPTTLGAMKCIGVLPGLGFYESSSSEASSDESDDTEKCVDKRDLLGRRPDQSEKRKEEGDNKS